MLSLQSRDHLRTRARTLLLQALAGILKRKLTLDQEGCNKGAFAPETFVILMEGVKKIPPTDKNNEQYYFFLITQHLSFLITIKVF